MQQQNRNIYLHKGLANIKPQFPLCSLGKNLVNFSATIKIRLSILLLFLQVSLKDQMLKQFY